MIREEKCSKFCWSRSEFMSFSEYYGITVRLCYPYRAQTKGKIENTIKYLRYNFWAGRSFESLSDINVRCQE